MNWSIYTPDRITHLKIVVVGLLAALLISVIGITASEFNVDTDIMTAQGPTVIKAGAPVMFTDRQRSVYPVETSVQETANIRGYAPRYNIQLALYPSTFQN